MADRYQDRPYPAGGEYDRSDDARAQPGHDSDPLAELARLIGQTDALARWDAPTSRFSRGTENPIRPPIREAVERGRGARPALMDAARGTP